APPTVRILHPRQPCNLQEERYAERVFTIREGATLELQCLVTGHPRPQVRWTKTVGGASERQVGPPLHNETLKIGNISRHQGGRYYCKADNGLGSPAIHSIRVDVYYLDDPVIWVHQSVGEMKEQFYFERTVFLRCAANGNPPVRYTWRRGHEVLSQGSDAGVEIYEPFFTQGETKILKLKNLRPQDYAEYSCISSVRSICGIRDKIAHFSLTNQTAPPSVKLLPEEPLVVNPGQTITLVCVASGGEPPPRLSWLRPGGEELPERSAVNGGTLTIPAATVEEGGAYTCLATNNVGGPVKKSVSVLVRGLRKARFWITPDPYHNDDNIQIGREVKISCQVEATPPEELQFVWLKNGRPLRSSERMVITHTDASVSPGTTNLDIIDLKFTDFGTYTCVASMANGGSPEISIDVNISSTTVPPELSVPRGRSHLTAQEGDTVDLQCLVSGKPKPILLWSRVEESSAAAAVAPPTMPDGSAQTESYDGVLRISNVSRDMSGTYRCQTSQYNGFNVKPREALIHLVVQFPPVVEPTFTEVRQALGRAFSLTCRLLQAHPARLLRYEWKLGPRLLTVGQFGHQRDDTTYTVKALNREGYGEYTCDITNEVGAGRCTFLVTGKAYAPEFYYDARGALWQNRPRGLRLQAAVDPDGARGRGPDPGLQTGLPTGECVRQRGPGSSVPGSQLLRLRQMSQSRWWEQQIPIEGTIQKGELLTYNLTELIKPESYLVRLTPITRFGEGDTTERTISYSTPVNPHLKEFQCGFEEEAICLFTQDKTDEFDWTRHSAATRNTKYTPNTGPSSDHNGSKQGYYMYIETSRPRQDGDKARLLTPTFNTNSRSSASLGHSPAYCFSFYYHMYGKHIGKTLTAARASPSCSSRQRLVSAGALSVFLRQKGPTVTDTSVWSLSGNQGDRWQQAKVNIQPSTAFQVLIEGVRGSGIEGDIAIDDVAIQEGQYLRSLAPPPAPHLWLLGVPLSMALIGFQR
ncbi:unnamed protein product, partial [Tetraodon nigroviridis]